ncbi:ankyrin repeat and EF-hand domain-containing protein 1-like [Bolinopsis microptera]|uniref:ankyrin repeat and EF-hand domain-containing protein 1-like n=1 Tax=Bolinopsis microptera TaxID=2820187 RepID=UPI003078CD4D
MADGFTQLQLLQGRKFLYCVKQGNASQVEKLCSNGVPGLINYIVNPEGEAGIHAAVKNADIDMMLLLLSLGASIDRRDNLGRTSLMIALGYGYDHVIDTLLEAEAKFNATDKEGRCVTWYALKPTQRHLRCLEKVCKVGADVNVVNSSTSTLLMKCAGQGLTASAQILLKHQAGTEIINGENLTALMIAVKVNNVEMVELLVKSGASIDVADSENLSPIHWCCKLGFTGLLTLLLNHGGEPDSLTNTGDTPLHLAVQGRHTLAVKILLSRGVQCEIPNYSAVTPRNIAHQLKDKVLKRLLRRHENAIHKACGEGKIRAGKDYWKLVLLKWNKSNCEAFIKECTLFDALGNGEVALETFISIVRKLKTPVSDRQLAEVLKSCDSGKVNYTDFLLGRLFIKLITYDNFARCKKKKKSGRKGGRGKKKKIPLHIVVEKTRVSPFTRSEDVVEKMEHFTDTARFPRDCPPKTFIEDDSSWYMAPPSTTYIRLHKAAQLGDLKTIEAACEDQVDLNQTDKFLKTPLMVAAANGRAHIAHILLRHDGVDVNMKDNFQWTALHHACHANQPDIAQLLVEHNADFDSQALNGGTPLMRAVESGSTEIVKILLARGAKINLRTKNEKTALDIAYEWGNSEIIDLITTSIAERQLTKKRGRRKSGKVGGRQPDSRQLDSGASAPFLKSAPEERSNVTFSAETKPGTAEVPLSKSAIAFNSGLSAPDGNFRSASAPPDLNKSVHSLRRRTNAWAHKPPTTEDLLNYKVEQRKRFGFEVADFKKPRSPFTSVIEDKMRPYILVSSQGGRPKSSVASTG